MQTEVKCPGCGKDISIDAEHAARTVKCRSCSYYFVPVEDVGVPCPGCGTVVLMSLSRPRQEISCLACGYVFGRRKLRFQPKLLWPLAGAAAIALIVVILLLALLNTVPRRVYANEAAAIANLRTLSSAEELFNCRSGNYTGLGQLASAGYIDGSLAAATSRRRAKNGYYFVMNSGSNTWSCIAMPAKPGETGTRSFYIDQTGAIRYRKCETPTDKPANANCKPLGVR